MQSILSTLLIATATFTSDVSSFSTGTGSCEAGIAAIENTNAGNSHIQYAGFPGSTSTRQGARGTLAEGATVLQIGGVLVDPGSTTTLPVGVDLTWEVIASQVAFKGIFVRLEKDSDDFTNVPIDADLQNVALCDSLTGVVGVGHTTSATKTLSSGTINFSTTGDATLDVIVVFDNVATSLYAWSSFPLSITDAVVPTAPTPVAAPAATPAPVADVPATESPAGTVTEVPVAAPVDEPGTETPVGAPVDEPVTETPVAGPVAEPPTDECPEEEGKGKGMMGMGKGGKGGKGMGKMSKGKKCKKTPKEPKTEKAGKGGKGKGADDESA